LNKNKHTKEPAKIPSQLFKRSTTRTIKKIESDMQYYFQAYSDLYKEYLHVLDDYFSICYLLEHRFYENQLHDEKSILHVFDDMVWKTTSMTLSQIDSFVNMHRMFVHTYTSTIKSLDQSMHQLLDYYRS